MTVKQVEELQAAVLGMLMNRVEGIFIDLQNALQVESGDISPLDAIKLQHKEEHCVPHRPQQSIHVCCSEEFSSDLKHMKEFRLP